MNFSRVAFLVVSLALANVAACSSCAKDDSGPAAVPGDGAASVPTDRQAAPMPYGFERRVPSLTTVPQVAVDAGPDATTTAK